MQICNEAKLVFKLMLLQQKSIENEHCYNKCRAFAALLEASQNTQ